PSQTIKVISIGTPVQQSSCMIKQRLLPTTTSLANWSSCSATHLALLRPRSTSLPRTSRSSLRDSHASSEGAISEPRGGGRRTKATLAPLGNQTSLARPAQRVWSKQDRSCDDLVPRNCRWAVAPLLAQQGILFVAETLSESALHLSQSHRRSRLSRCS